MQKLQSRRARRAAAAICVWRTVLDIDARSGYSFAGERGLLPYGVTLATISNLGVGLPTEPIGSIPRPAALIEGVQAFEDGRGSQEELNALYDSAVRDTIQCFEATGSPVITDGEQGK